MLNSFTDLEKEFDAGVWFQLVLPAVILNGGPFYKFHDQVRRVILCNTPVEKPGDIGMLQPGVDDLFLSKPSSQIEGVHSAPTKWNCASLFALAHAPLGQLDSSHRSSTQQLPHHPG